MFFDFLRLMGDCYLLMSLDLVVGHRRDWYIYKGMGSCLRSLLTSLIFGFGGDANR